MMQRMEEVSLLLKVFLDEDREEFYSVNGLRMGEAISFGSQIKIPRRPQTIRFQLIDACDLGCIYA